MIKNAEIVVTDSFHGSVFSLIFNTPLVTIKNKARGATRFASLFNLFGISYSDSSTFLLPLNKELESLSSIPNIFSTILDKGNEWIFDLPRLRCFSCSF